MSSVSYDASDECPVCLTDESDPVFTDPCLHFICRDCYCNMRLDCIKNPGPKSFPCPICRTSVTGHVVSLAATERARLSRRIKQALTQERLRRHDIYTSCVGKLCAEAAAQHISDTARDVVLWRFVCDDTGVRYGRWQQPAGDIPELGRNRLHNILYNKYGITLTANCSVLTIVHESKFVEFTAPGLVGAVMQCAKTARWDLSTGLPTCQIQCPVHEQLRVPVKRCLEQRRGITCVWHEQSAATGLVFTTHEAVLQFLQEIAEGRV